ncbi:MAG: electron transfer flavoprotein subunit beta/FixA family protein [Fusobacteriaceae bacterium]|jgi:electron transfer flavoprotein beta subunit|nr:electron transfer flavoprotein subunit beta/FixA family protein [Fusobacteriaceae bacterium]
MEVIVFIKQVPSNENLKVDREKGMLVREGVPSIMNTPDKNAVEEAIKLKEKFGGNVTVVTMGLPQAKEILSEAIAMGADQGILVSDRSFGGSDTLATATILAGAAKKIGKFDVILCGMEASDGATGQIPSKLAEILDIPALTCAEFLEITKDTATIIRTNESFKEKIQCKLPLVCSVSTKINIPRIPSEEDRKNAEKSVFLEFSNKELNLNEADIGANGSPTKVAGSYLTPERKKGIIIKGSDEKDAGKKLIIELLSEKII